LRIYAHIIRAVGCPTPKRVKQYTGLLLSCCEIYYEFENEAVKTTKRTLDAIQTEWSEYFRPLRLPTISSLADTVRSLICMPAEITHSTYTPVVGSYGKGKSGLHRNVHESLTKFDDRQIMSQLLDNLMDCLPSFCLYRWHSWREEDEANTSSAMLAKYWEKGQQLSMRVIVEDATNFDAGGNAMICFLYDKIWIHNEETAKKVRHRG
jgi:hypothetical protein